MANTQKYLNHLLQGTGITPACSEEERAEADIIAKTFSDHGFEPEVQEFSASGSAKVVQAVLGIAAFLGAVLMGIGGVAGVLGLLLSVVAAVLFAMERTGRPVLSKLGAGGLSQNVIACHKASGPLASPRNRPVVIVAHYDSPRVDLLCREPYAAYRPLLVKLLPYTMPAPAVIAVVRLLPIPEAAKVVLWLIAIVAALVPLSGAVAIIANRFVLPYTTGSVCNKSSVAAMLGVMDAVSPYQGAGEEFPGDVPFDEYFAEQRRIAEEAIAAAEAAAEAEVAYPHEQEGEVAAADGVESGDGVEQAAPEAPDPDAGQYADRAEEAAAGAGATAAFEALDPSSTVSMGSTDVMGAVAAAAEPTAAAAAVTGGAGAVEAAVPPADGAFEADGGDGASDAVDKGASEVDDGAATAVDGGAAAGKADDGEVAPGETGHRAPSVVNADGNYRYGADAIRGLGMVAASCALVYEDDGEAPEDTDRPAPDAARDTETSVEGGSEAAAAPAPDAEDDDDDDIAVDGSAVPAAVGAAEPEEVGEPDGVEEAEKTAEPPEAVKPATPEPVAPVEVVEPADFVDEDDIIEVAPEDIEVLDDDGDDDGRAAVTEDSPAESSEGGREPRAGEQDSPADVESAPKRAARPAADGPDRPAVDVDLGSTQVFRPTEAGTDDPTRTVSMPARPVETVDSLMAEISNAVPATPHAPKPRVISVPGTSDAPAPRTPETANRSSLFDLPDPSATPMDPFASPVSRDMSDAAAAARSAFTVVGSSRPAAQAPAPAGATDRVETISAPAPAREEKHGVLSKFFSRKKKNDDSMSEWLGVEDDFDAKRGGADIGSWDNFDDDDSGWKGGAAGAEGVSEEELRQAVTSMGDDELLGHDIWFVATGASENGNAGIQAFLNEHRDKLRGVFLINLECIGAGSVVMLGTEGERRALKGDKRIMKLVSRVSADFHHEYGAVDMPYVTTDAYPAMCMSLRSLTLAGIEGSAFALGHTEEDQPFNVDPENVSMVADVVTEVIRRS